MKKTIARPLIVGVGAWVGGLEAFQSSLAAIGDAAAFTVVFVQHRDPSGKDVLAELIRSVTPTPFVELGSPIELVPGYVYICPPQSLVSIDAGVVRLETLPADQRAVNLIDHFLHALAEDQGDRSIGVILSGSGSDGTLGLKAISDQGGLTFAQDSESAKFDSMPRSAATTGVADHVLPPSQIAMELLQYARHLGELTSPKRLQDEIEEAIPAIADILFKSTEHNFQHYKTNTLVRRVQRRMQVLKIGRSSDYVNYLTNLKDEAQALFRELLIGVTAFFRDPEAFETLKREVLPKLFDNRTSDDCVRIWVAGCANGAEAYTIAMLCREVMDEVASPCSVQIFATDIDERALSIGRSGEYPVGIEEHISPERLKRFFIKRGKRYQVTKELRDLVLFSAHNLISDPPFSRQDLISCRNLLIYLGAHLQNKLIPLFHYSLRPSGYLLLGPSENITSHSELFRPVNARLRISQRKGTAVGAPTGMKLRSGMMARPNDETRPPESTDLTVMMQKIALDEFTPAIARAHSDLENLLRSTQIATIFLDDELRIRSFTPAIADLYSLIATDVGRSLQNFAPRVKEMPALPDPKSLQSDSAVECTILADSGKSYIRRILPYQSHTGHAEGVVVTFTDITELKERERQFRTLAESIPQLAWMANTDGNIFWYNRRWYEYTGTTLDLMQDWGWQCVHDPDELPKVLERWKASIATGTPFDMTFPLKGQDGQFRPFLTRVEPVKDEMGRVVRWFGTNTDITARKESEDRLRMSEQRMRLATEATGVGIWEWNVITDKIRWDAMMFLIYGIAPTPDGVVQYSEWREAVLPEDLDKQETVLRDTVQRLGSSSRNFRIKRRNDGQCRVIDCVETVRTNEKGEADWVVGTNLDVTDRKRAELELVEQKRKLDLAMQVGGMGAWSLDIQTQNLRGDAILLNLFGFETTTSPSLDQYFNRIHCDDRDLVSRAVTDAIENGSTYDQEFRIDLPNGGVRWVRSYAQNFPSSQGSAKEFTGITYEVTDRKLRKLDFADREAHLRRVINDQLGLVGVIDRDGILLEVDDRSLAIAEARREEVIGKHFADAPWWNYDPAVAQQMRAAMRRAFDGDVVRYDVSLFAHGDAGVMIDFMIAPVINDLGEVEFLIPSGVDIRERHAAELATRESERLVRQNEEKFRVMADGLPSLIWVYDAEGDYLLEIINDILDLSKIEAGKLELNREPFDPVRVVEDVRSIMNVRASENHLQLNVHYEGKLPRQIKSDPKRLKQILINLVGNAIKFTKKGHVDIVVRFDRGIGFQPVDDNNVKKNRLEANPTLQFEIIDSGVGMSNEQQAKLFKPFTQGDSSISRHFGGTGLGLAISRRLATMLGGDIAAESKLGEGSKFSVVIQTGSIHDVEFTEPQLAIKAPPPASPTVDQNSLDCSVLVVDDRRDIRFLSKRILTNAGATVDECEEGMLAVEHITDRMTRNQCPDLILLDMQMPNLDGYQTARKLRELGYTGPIIALTADAMQGDMNQCLNAGCNDYLSKPIVAKRLVDLVAELTRSEPVQ